MVIGIFRTAIEFIPVICKKLNKLNNSLHFTSLNKSDVGSTAFNKFMTAWHDDKVWYSCNNQPQLTITEVTYNNESEEDILTKACYQYNVPLHCADWRSVWFMANKFTHVLFMSDEYSKFKEKGVFTVNTEYNSLSHSSSSFKGNEMTLTNYENIRIHKGNIKLILDGYGYGIAGEVHTRALKEKFPMFTFSRRGQNTLATINRTTYFVTDNESLLLIPGGVSSSRILKVNKEGIVGFTNRIHDRDVLIDVLIKAEKDNWDYDKIKSVLLNIGLEERDYYKWKLA